MMIQKSNKANQLMQVSKWNKISDDSPKVQELIELVIYLEMQFERPSITIMIAVLFYTGFPNYSALIASYDYLGL